MKRLVFLFVFVLLLRPCLAFSYAGELSNGNETYGLITNLSFEGKDYFLYGIYQDNQTQLIIIQDSLDNLVTNNETIQGVFYAYRYGIVVSSANETIENPRIASDNDFGAFYNRFQEKSSSVENDISDIESVTPQYQALIMNLSSQGAYASKSIELFSQMQDLIWQSKMMLYQNRFNSAEGILEEAKGLAPNITLDVRSSFRVNDGSLALEKTLTEISGLRKQGYNTTDIEAMFDDANSALTEAKDSYTNGNYDGSDPKISSVLDSIDNISYEIEKMKAVTPQTQENVSSSQPTGLSLANYSWLSYVVGVVTVAAIVVLFVYRRRSSKFNYHYKQGRFF